MTSLDDMEMLAAEYVLGTLDDTERAEAQARRGEDAAFDAAVVGWEARLAPLLSYPAEVAPRDLLAQIEARILARDAAVHARPGADEEILTLRRRVGRWRLTAFSAMAAAAVLAAVMLVRPGIMVSDADKFVAVFQENDEQPAFLMSIDLATRELTIRPVTARVQPGKTYQLWIASDKLGPGPKSLGLLDTPRLPTRKTLAQFDAKLLETATFGISLEPEGGSPTGRPTGPAIHGKLIPTAL